MDTTRWIRRDTCGCHYAKNETNKEEKTVPAYCKYCYRDWVVNCGVVNCLVCKNTTVRSVSDLDLRIYGLTRWNDRCFLCRTRILYVCKENNGLYMAGCIAQLHHMIETKAHRLAGIFLPVTDY
jgi:hypothetical protein